MLKDPDAVLLEDYGIKELLDRRISLELAPTLLVVLEMIVETVLEKAVVIRGLDRDEDEPKK